MYSMLKCGGGKLKKQTGSQDKYGLFYVYSCQPSIYNIVVYAVPLDNDNLLLYAQLFLSRPVPSSTSRENSASGEGKSPRFRGAKMYVGKHV